MATINITVSAHSYPTANAGSPQNITLPTNSLTLVATGTPSDGATIVTYAWVQLSGPACTITSPSSSTTTVTNLNNPGTYVFKVVVTDSDGLSANASVTETVIGYDASVGGTLTVDVYDPSINAYMYIHAVDSSVNDQISYTGNNFFPGSATPPEQCWILSSDLMSFSGSTGYRFEANISKLLTYFPSVNIFTIIIAGRDTTPSTFNGAYVLHGADSGQMIMGGSPGTYIPSTSSTSLIGITPYSGITAPSGADGTYGFGIGSVLMTFIYNRTTKVLSMTHP